MYGIRLRSVAQSIGSVFDFFIPYADMPEADNPRGYDIFEDIIETPYGNTYLYSKGKRKRWQLSFQQITPRTKDALEHIAHGWLTQKQVTIVFFGTSVTGTATPPGSLQNAGQLWGTGFVRITGLPREVDVDLWNLELQITEFGTSQAFT